MPEDKNELSESRQQRHADLAAEHNRLKIFHEKHSGGKSGSANSDGQPDTSGEAGKGFGDFFSTIGEHKFLVIGVIAAIIFAYVLFNNSQNSNSTSDTTGSSNFDAANFQTQLDTINSELSALQQQGNTGTGTTGTGSTGTTTTPTPPVKGVPPPVNGPIQPRYVTVTKWTPVNTPWNSTLWGIASKEGISLNRIEALNPNVANPNVIYAGQRIRVK